MDVNTKLTRIGRNPKKQKRFVNPGIFKGSTMIFDNFQDYLDDINNADDRTTLYGINQNPSHKQLEESISKLYYAADTVIASSGLAALIIPFFAYLKKDDEVLINDTIYSPTRTFCENKINFFRITWNIYF